MAIAILEVIVVLIVIGHAPSTAIAVTFAAGIAAAEVAHRMLIWPTRAEPL